jgi:membrane protein
MMQPGPEKGKVPAGKPCIIAAMNLFARRLFGAFRRTVPACIPQTQAIAFNMFLAFFPAVLIVLGIVASSGRLRDGLLDVVRPLRPVLPPGMFPILAGFLSQRGTHAWQLILLGLGGAVVAGTHMMRLVIDGFQMVYQERQGPTFWGRNLRAFVLLLITIAPWLLAAILIVFGRQVRTWAIRQLGWPALVGILWSVLYVAVSLAIAMGVLAVMYRVGRLGAAGWQTVSPGAAVATLLWWIVSWAFGVYMRHVPYRALYGGLAVAIGLMLWMELTATIILIGAAYNAECATTA